ncbi:13035_t:CDS:1, partial [Acaulospora colombiana]
PRDWKGEIASYKKEIDEYGSENLRYLGQVTFLEGQLRQGQMLFSTEVNSFREVYARLLTVSVEGIHMDNILLTMKTGYLHPFQSRG